MHHGSPKEDPRLLLYTSMTRRRHIGTHINRDREGRYIKNHPQSADIINAQNDLSTTNCRSLSPAIFEDYIRTRGVSQRSIRSSLRKWAL